MYNKIINKQLWSSVFNSKGVIPTDPKVVPFAAFTFRDFFYHVNFIRIFLQNNYCDMHEHVAPVSNRTDHWFNTEMFNCKG